MCTTCPQICTIAQSLDLVGWAHLAGMQVSRWELPLCKLSAYPPSRGQFASSECSSTWVTCWMTPACHCLRVGAQYVMMGRNVGNMARLDVDSDDDTSHLCTWQSKQEINTLPPMITWFNQVLKRFWHTNARTCYIFSMRLQRIWNIERVEFEHVEHEYMKHLNGMVHHWTSVEGLPTCKSTMGGEYFGMK